jgi:hypothetical protein
MTSTDQTTNQTNQLSTVQFMQQHQDYNEARRILYEQGIKTKFTDKHIMFTAEHKAKRLINDVKISECNGLILARDTLKVLAVPPKSLCFSLDTQRVNQHLYQGLYSVFEARDGTTFTLYYDSDAWHIATTNGITMRDVIFDDKSTYGDLINECLRVTARMDLTQLTERLDINKCYSFGFAHWRTHPTTITADIWFIQSVQVNADAKDYLWLSRVSPVEEISGLKEVALRDVETMYRMSKNSEDEFYKTGVCHFGFILRSANEEATGMYSNLFIESRLMKKIRQYWYDSAAVQMCNTRRLPRRIVIGLTNYLLRDTNFTLLFPNTQSDYDLYDEILNQVTHCVNHQSDQMQTGQMQTGQMQTNQAQTNLNQNKYDNLIYKIAGEFARSDFALTYLKEDSQKKSSLFAQWLRNIKHFETFVSLLELYIVLHQ